MADAYRGVDVTRIRSGVRTIDVDRAATEEPLEIRLHNRPFSVIMRTPGSDRELAAGFLLVGVLLEVQVLGSSLPPRHVWRAVTIFLLLASLVYAVMVVAPKARYYDERSATFEENLRAPWHARRDAARARGSKIDFVGFVLALAALVLG